MSDYLVSTDANGLHVHFLLKIQAKEQKSKGKKTYPVLSMEHIECLTTEAQHVPTAFLFSYVIDEAV